MGLIWNAIKTTVKVTAFVTGLGIVHGITETIFFDKKN